ncbi:MULTISPECIES: siroheme synthase CysG [unclassified Oceanobacter]|uniref:siroheme synthase CysG n=1 Tax=unclassified Oceanobacter TaxID=2620260 RepID=UPI0026E16C77|nr:MULTISPECIES: siroheme synthase CysG [unclassified Oceanobacter]MDO6681086.1 siroheme synthase CysG [Oceanobacter sp. 5_MG-2023]MDP2504342.1 siroheme synthase CysG [Oceanobacter sp. 3_MG-2023]MDP2546780.1 siroheme synthase CysG [Oceanobacter sp. 4_MG-2023]
MMTLPLVLKGDIRPFYVVGGGAVAGRKVHTLVQAGAAVTVITPSAGVDIARLAQQGSIQLEAREATEQEVFVAGAFVVLATDNHSLNATLAVTARQQGCFVCRVDCQDDNDFIFPAVIDRSPLLVAISSRGASPALTRHMRQRLDAFLPQEYRQLGEMLERMRDQVKERLAAPLRAAFWRQVMRSNVPELVLARQPERAQLLANQLLAGQTVTMGEVYLVGAGPGDPDLLTFRALRLIQSADVVFYDRLVGPGVMALIASDAERVYVGKAKSNHAVPQEEISQRLADEARKGRRVLRLKGGDPFIFGRGGEEIELLAQYGVPFQVVPGITAASGCAAYAGIPLTHRDHAQSVRFVTGHLRDGSCNLPWSELIHPHQTLVVYMGLSGIAEICRQLVKHGMAASTPIALVEKGTLPDQKVHVSTLADMPDFIAANEVHAPTLTIIGSVVGLHGKLAWRSE